MALRGHDCRACWRTLASAKRVPKLIAAQHCLICHCLPCCFPLLPPPFHPFHNPSSSSLIPPQSTFEPAGQIKGQGDPTGPNFNKPFIGATTIGILFAGFYVIYGGSQFQNRKHGFPQKPSA